MFAAREKEFEQKVEELEIGAIPESDLKLSPLVLPSRFVDERQIAGIDRYGSNTDLIDPEAAAALASREMVDTSPCDQLSIASGQDRHPVDGETVPGMTEKTKEVLVVSDSSGEGREDGREESADQGDIEGGADMENDQEDPPTEVQEENAAGNEALIAPVDLVDPSEE